MRLSNLQFALLLPLAAWSCSPLIVRTEVLPSQHWTNQDRLPAPNKVPGTQILISSLECGQLKRANHHSLIHIHQPLVNPKS